MNFYISVMTVPSAPEDDNSIRSRSSSCSSNLVEYSYQPLPDNEEVTEFSDFTSHLGFQLDHIDLDQYIREQDENDFFHRRTQERFEKGICIDSVDDATETTLIPEIQITQEFNKCMTDFRQNIRENAAPPMDPETVETIKEIMKGIPFPEHAIPLWSKRIPEKMWIP